MNNVSDSQYLELGAQVESGAAVLKVVIYGLDQQLSSEAQPKAALSGLYYGLAGTTANTAVTASLSSFFNSSDISQYATSPPPISPDDWDSLAKRFSAHDAELGKVVAQIPENLYGSISNPERSAMYMERQTFDHFFDHLAPDSKVQQSPYFKEKNTEPKNLVHREERIAFALATRITDAAKRSFLEANTKGILEVYRKLNAAHKRGPLTKENANATIEAMRVYLASWLDALGW